MKFNYTEEFDHVKVKTAEKYTYLTFFKEGAKHFVVRIFHQGKDSDCKLKRKKDWNQLYDFSFSFEAPNHYSSFGRFVKPTIEPPIIRATWTESSIFPKSKS